MPCSVEIEEFLTGRRATPSTERMLATILFTDIVDSTQRAAGIGDRQWRELLDSHDRMAERQVRRFGGRQIKSTGDGPPRHLRRSGARDSVGRAICEGARQLGIEVRVGVHTGEVRATRADDRRRDRCSHRGASRSRGAARGGLGVENGDRPGHRFRDRLRRSRRAPTQGRARRLAVGSPWSTISLSPARRAGTLAVVWFRRATGLVLAVLAVSGMSLTTAAASASVRNHGLVVRFAANKSQNWSGYNQGSHGARRHRCSMKSPATGRPDAEPTSSRRSRVLLRLDRHRCGCVDTACSIGDNTLIQTGTEQDIAANGKRTYTAWYELIPAPETPIPSLIVHPGDRMHAEIKEQVAGSNVWTIILNNATTGQKFQTTKPYSSSHLTVEWIQERPTLISSGGTTLAPLPKLTNPKFDHGLVNGAAAGLKAAQEILMTNASGAVIARPSAPDPDADGFNACTYTASCAAPTAG